MAKAKLLGLQIIMALSYSINTRKAACQDQTGTQRSVAVAPILAGDLKRRRQRKVRFTDV